MPVSKPLSGQRSCSATMDLILRPPRIEDEAAVRLLHEQLAVEGFAFLPADGSWEHILSVIEAEAAGINLPPGRVPADFLVAEIDGQIIGRVSIRHRLTDILFEAGGHIGYAVGPQFRRRGYATQILRQAVQRLTALGVHHILVICDADNVASAGVIEKCGGVLEPETPESDTAIKRYWVRQKTG